MHARRSLAALLLLHASVLAACATPLLAPRDTGELVFWKITRADGAGGSAHLLGTLHVGQDALHFDPAIESALGAAQELVLEVAPGELEPSAVRKLLQRLGQLPDGRTLRDVLAPETFTAVEAEFAARKIAIEPWLGWEPWVVSLALAGDALETEGYAREHGVERQLVARVPLAPEQQRPVRGLESAELQIARLDALSPETQELLLADAVSEKQRSSSAAVITDAWRRGDLRAIEREIFEKLGRRRFAAPDAPAAEFFEAIYFARNREFAAGIAQLIDAGGRWFVALGAAHMVGDQGIPALLAARGYRVERIPKSPAPRGAEER
jgi:hypothetical protein